MKRLSLLIPVFLLFAVGAEAAAQEGEGAEPNVVTVRYFKCPLDHQGEAVEMLNTGWRPIVEEMIEEGHFVDYGILTHAWGDEWNVMDYFVSTDLVSFHEGISEAFQRAGERLPEPETPFGELCPYHKDNHYFVVHPPSDEESGEGGEGQGDDG